MISRASAERADGQTTADDFSKATQVRRDPKRSCAPPNARRKPVITSSKINNAPFSLVIFREEFQEAGLRQIQTRRCPAPVLK
jgi:hypothetical protein